MQALAGFEPPDARSHATHADYHAAASKYACSTVRSLHACRA
jgi:hypothetical protein